ncbi:MAG: hypothetical protein NVS1B4_22870 [Gemmatimonadaceae bacterium]
MTKSKEATYDARQIATKLREMPGWSYNEGSIRRSYDTKGWPQTLMLVNALGYAAEVANHHPDLTVSWSKVGVALNTHSAGGITDKDFSLARTFDGIAGG